jgi:glyoxylase-like metal-dependent hydrolase (beta-lactamase superfamily II)
MDGSSIEIGRVRITAIIDGVADRAPITETFPRVPAGPLLAYKERHPGIYGEDDRWRLIVRAWLLEHPEGVTLVDTGVGPADWFPEPGRLVEALSALGVASGDIPTVVITHVHDDHIGGTVTPAGSPAFENARYLIQSADLAAQRRWGERDDDDRDVWERLLLPLVDAGVIDEIEGDRPLTDLIGVRLAAGHTPGHQIVNVHDGDAHLVITSDTWNHPLQFAHPEWPSGHDHDHERAEATRRALLEEFTADPAPILAPTHFADAFGTIEPDRDGAPSWRSHGD